MPTKKILSPQEDKPIVQPRFNQIILIDDSEIDLFINQAIIKTISLTQDIITTSEPADVLNQLTNTSLLSDVPELIFLDMDMKSMSGFTFLEEFSKLSDFVKSKCKIVITTSSQIKEEKLKALMHPSVIRYFVKPLDVSHLRDFMFS